MTPYRHSQFTLPLSLAARTMDFNPDPTKQATEVIFSRKNKPVNHPTLYFNNSPVTSAPFQKHLGYCF